MIKKAEKILIYISICVCVVLFFLLMMETTDKFAQRMTTVGVNIKESSLAEKMLPCITVCPWMAFKSFRFYYTSGNFTQNTYEKEEVFLNATKYTAFDESKYALEEIRSIFLGRCYTIWPLKPKKRTIMSYLALKNTRDYKGNCLSSQFIICALNTVWFRELCIFKSLFEQSKKDLAYSCFHL